MADRTITLHAKTTSDGRGLLEAARDLEKTADAVEDLGGSMRATAEDSRRLGRQIEETGKKAQDLRMQIARTGDEGLFVDLAREESRLRRLQRLSGNLFPQGGGNFLGAIPRIGGVPGPVIAGGVAATAALSPAIGATIAAAVLGGVGTGGLIGGVALASQDTRVQAAFKEFGQSAFKELGDAASPFVGPLVDSAHKFGDAFREELPEIERNFAVLSKAVEPLTEGVIGFVHNIGPGLRRAFSASIPLAEQFGEEMGGLGTAVSDGLEDMADAAPGAKVALHDLFTVIDEGGRATSETVKLLSQVYDLTRKIPLSGMTLKAVPLFGLVGALSNLDRAIDGTDAAMEDAAPSAEELQRKLRDQADAAREAADAIERNTKAIKDYFDTIDDQQDSAERYHRALLDLHDAVHENGVSLAITTREGLANRDALQEAARATREMHAAGLLTDDAYRQQIESLERLAVNLGFNRDQVLALIGALEKMPRQVVTEAVLKVSGMIGSFQDVLFNRIPAANRNAAQQGRAGTDFSVVPVQGQLSRQAFIDMPTRDSGGPVAPGRSYLIGRPEILTMGSMGGHVTPLPGRTVVEFRSDGTRVGDLLLELFAVAVGNRGGNVQVAVDGVRR